MDEYPNVSNSILDVEFTEDDKKFLEDLKEHSKQSGASFKTTPLFLNRPVNLHAIYQNIIGLGGYHKFHQSNLWRVFTPPGESHSKASALIITLYEKYLLRYERDHFQGYGQVEKDEKNYSDSESSVEDKLNSELSDSSEKPIHLVKGTKINKIDSNLDDDLQKYFMGPPDTKWLFESDRIALALESGLPNEIEWALSSLTQWSKSCPADFLLERSSLLTLRLQKLFETHVYDLESILKKGSGNLVTEAFLLIALSIRNFSFIKANAKYLAETTTIPCKTFSIITLKFPVSPLISTFGYPELQSYCLDLLDNMGSFMSPPSHFFSWLSERILGTDRGLLLGSLRILSRLSLGECLKDVEKLMYDGKIIKYLLNLLVLPNDFELKNASADYLLLLSYFVPFELSNCIISLHHNAIKTIMQLVLDSLLSPEFHMDQAQKLLVKNNFSASLAFEKWLRNACTLSPKDMVSPRELYQEYTSEQLKNDKLVSIPSENFVLLVLKIFPWCQIIRRVKDGKLVVFILGITRPISKSTIENSSKSSVSQRGAIPREYTCLWDKCGVKIKNKALLLSHLRSAHLATKLPNYSCKWDFCLEFKTPFSRPALLSHLQAHMLELQPSFSSKNMPKDLEKPSEPVLQEGSINIIAEHISILIDLLKKLSSFSELQELFISHQDILVQISLVQPSFSKDIFYIIENINSLPGGNSLENIS